VIVVIIVAVLKDLESIANLISVTNLITYSFVSACGLALRYRPDSPTNQTSLLGGEDRWVWFFMVSSYISAMFMMHFESRIVQGLSIAVCFGFFVKIVRAEQPN
jgi:amino acid transporter